MADILKPRAIELEQAVPAAVKQRRARQVKVYVQPVTGKHIETKSANNAQLKVQLGFTFPAGKQTEHVLGSEESRAQRFYSEVAGF